MAEGLIKYTFSFGGFWSESTFQISNSEPIQTIRLSKVHRFDDENEIAGRNQSPRAGLLIWIINKKKYQGASKTRWIRVWFEVEFKFEFRFEFQFELDDDA